MTQHQMRRDALANFLRTRRARLTPAEVGMAPGLRRRTPGLRREELAVLAGVGVTWYTWLEQGRDINPSPEVLGSLARTLRLSPAETDYLFRLAGSRPVPRGTIAPAEPPAALVRLVRAQSPWPAFLIDGGWDVRAWNSEAEALFDFSRWEPEDRNIAWIMFAHRPARERTVDWERHARRLLAQLRADYAQLGGNGTAGGRQLAELIHRLRDHYPQANRWLDEHQVQDRSNAPVKELRHEAVGLLRIEQLTLRAPDELQLLVLTPSDEESDQRMRLLGHTVSVG
ncbi:helix-turn-helix transcriptional regulator [Kitasatospora sp. NBC_01287]|uniref:helix-turn-helix transcriptional regulator n=1 Tax=Kitasatospora sp. NBC_01287 TaxID=2903573 RepID=UPI00224F3CAF|nr:helix-turn-helix transcriptional regulator [Kitasatospora sp. NBC_01287]MCX4749758.1 helix-turn-helix transcriptional regulator [Kitasatospora sp. NBC_01287]